MVRLLTISTCFIMMMLLNSAKTDTQNRVAFTSVTDIGSPKLKGSTIFDQSLQVYTLTGGGLNIWANTDQFHLLTVTRNIKSCVI